MTAATVTAQPDLEAWVWENLRGIPGVTCFAYAAQQLDARGWLYSHSIQVDARDSRKQVARDRAEQARQAMAGLPDVPWAGGVVVYLQPVEGPFWLPDPDGRPRYCARYEVRVRPSRDNWRPGISHRASPARHHQGEQA